MDDPQGVMEVKRSRWSGIWNRHQDEVEELEKVLGEVREKAMREKKEVKPLTEEELDKAISYYPPKKGKGTDQHTT
eukprot:5468762-Lingulodinium_polyedra.AAC.1